MNPLLRKFLPEVRSSENPDFLLKKVRVFWTILEGFPVPAWMWYRCPVCESKNLQARQWAFSIQKKSLHPWRCNVHMKCRNCSFTLQPFGIPIPVETFELRSGRVWHWMEVRKILKEAGLY